MWIVWIERNRCLFKGTEKLLVLLKDLCQRTLFDWSWYWGFLDCSSIIEFLLSLKIVFFFFFLVIIMNTLYSFLTLLSIILLLLPIKKKI